MKVTHRNVRIANLDDKSDYSFLLSPAKACSNRELFVLETAFYQPLTVFRGVSITDSVQQVFQSVF